MTRFADFDRDELASLQNALAHPSLPPEAGSRVEKMLDELERVINERKLVGEAREILKGMSEKAGVSVEEMAERVLREWRPSAEVPLWK